MLSPVKIFICYAHEDEVLLNELKKQLKPLQRMDLIEMWHDRDINAGAQWEREIDKHLNNAQIILLLISPDFMASEYCYSKEMQRALELQKRGEAQVIPIILRHAYWHIGALGALQALPTDGKPVKSWPSLDEGFFDVVKGVHKVVESLKDPKRIKVEREENIIHGGFMGSGYIRRLPVYLLLDCSGSMAGDPIIAVNEGLSMIYHLLMGDPQALETVYLSVITFADRADQYQLVSLDQFQPPPLVAGGARSFGYALRLLAESIEQDLVLNTPAQRGDFRPLVFITTDGEPTDDYRSAVARLQQLRGSRKPTIVALGCGSGVNTSMLHEVTSNVFLMHTVSPEAIKAFFKWISGSIAQTSRALGSSNPDQTTMMAPPTIPGTMYSPN